MIRKSRLEDIGAMMQIIAQSQEWFRSQGIDQWQDGYPTPEVLREDIRLGESYVMELEEKIVATAVISFTKEPTYTVIYDGDWLNSNPYAVIHRMAVSSILKGQRLAERFIGFAKELCCERGIGDIRIDTHIDNIPMQRLISRVGFIHCGRIVLESGADREAYQYVL